MYTKAFVRTIEALWTQWASRVAHQQVIGLVPAKVLLDCAVQPHPTLALEVCHLSSIWLGHVGHVDNLVWVHVHDLCEWLLLILYCYWDLI